MTLLTDARYESIASLKVNGQDGKWSVEDSSISVPKIKIECTESDKYDVEIEWAGDSLKNQSVQTAADFEKNWRFSSTNEILTVFDPQQVLGNSNFDKNTVSGKIIGEAGHRTVFLKVKQGDMFWWQPVDIFVKDIFVKDTTVDQNFKATELEIKPNAKYETVDMDNCFDDSVNRIFKNKYMSPRSPYTTLEVPTQGIGEWCHPLLTANIDDSGLRKAVKNNVFMTPMGIPFRSVGTSGGKNVAFTSLWDNFPDSIVIPLSGKASAAYLLMAGTTNHMQFRVTNGEVEAMYTDGTTSKLDLINPETWMPIEQDFYVDGKAFKLHNAHPYRVAFKSGIVSQDLSTELKIKPSEVYGRDIDGGAGIILRLQLDSKKELKALKVKSVANEVIIGLMSVTLLR